MLEEEPLGELNGFRGVSGILEELHGLDPGCLRLMQEIVIRAVQDLFEEGKCRTNSTDNAQHVMGSARYWLFYDESTEPFTFRWICDVLGIDRDTFLVWIKTRTIKNAKGQKFHYADLLKRFN